WARRAWMPPHGPQVVKRCVCRCIVAGKTPDRSVDLGGASHAKAEGASIGSPSAGRQIHESEVMPRHARRHTTALSVAGRTVGTKGDPGGEDIATTDFGSAARARGDSRRATAGAH